MSASPQLRHAALSDGHDVNATNAALRTYFGPIGSADEMGVVRRGPRKATRDLMAEVVRVLERFTSTMSTRQVYYQLVSLGAVENNDGSYEKVQRLVVKMRRDGFIQYDRIVDRGRASHQLAGWAGVREVMSQAQRQYRRDAWAEQDIVVMVALEKAALEGIFANAVDEWGAQLWTLRGFSSESFAYEWSEAIERLTGRGQQVVIRYFGDFDPSGLALERDAVEKLSRFGADFEWERHGLLLQDFDRFDLVRVPVKPSDTRTKKFVSMFGDCAAELDALDPDELTRRIHEAIVDHVDVERWKDIERIEAVEKESLSLVVNNWDAALAAARAA